jgi:pentose-5-phosphate-3-epimerase
VVIAHVEANVHLHRTLDNIRQMGTRPHTLYAYT